ncbi:MAG: fimbria/pilus periplasmic chaperone [Thermodesulfobacteriota bacterium]
MRISALFFPYIPALPVARLRGNGNPASLLHLRYLLIFLFVFPLFAFHAEKLFAADFTISPVRVFIASGKKTDIVTIKNNSDDNLTVQMSAFLWEQDAEAKDVLTPTEEVILFPKIVIIKGKEERILRLGVKYPATDAEKTYRIFIEEVPEPQEKQPEGAYLRTLMKIGVPVFVSPAKVKAEAIIDAKSLKNGVLSFSIKNSGNVHELVKTAHVEGFDAKDNEVFKKDLAGWYVHRGKAKPFSTEIPKDVCASVKMIKIKIDTDRTAISDRMDVSPDMCSP